MRAWGARDLSSILSTPTMGKEILRPCEAPFHSDDCDGIGSTKDHFTPKCIARLWGWTEKEINAEENIQYLSRPCHDDKDRSTHARLILARLQLEGAYIALGEHQLVDEPDFKEKHKKLIEDHKRHKLHRKGKYCKHRRH